MNRMKLARECVEIDEAGGNVLDFLRMRGCISPWGTWYRLQIEELGRKQGQITEGKGGNDMRKMTLEEKKKAVQIALDGGDPLAYLKSLGSKKPDALWYAIQSRLMDADPDTFEKLMLMKKYKEPEEATTCCAPSTRKGVEVPDEIPEEKPTAQLTVKAEDLKAVMDAPVADAAEILKHTVIALEDDFRIYGLITKIGDFQAVDGWLAWYKTKEDMINMRVEDWKKILEVVPKVMAVMGL